MGLKTTVFEPEKYFRTPAAQAHLLSEALASGDAGHIADAVGIVARQHGIGEIARQTGLNRQGLYAALSPDGNPTLSTVLKVLEALNMELSVRVRDAA
jgi:probable addiction module antidote protein